MTDHQIVYFLSGADNNSVKTEDCFFKKVGIPGRERLSEKDCCGSSGKTFPYELYMLD
ncbi:hypothetical protein [Chryseobacterium taeanense]|uniref:hypothetical protein n=1 Tax=Chryseobacterium taeanense TaxID=311334 RepID=UPI0035AF8BE6